MVILLFIAGIILLMTGGELLVRGASRLAVLFGISPLIVGLTIVSFMTSAPELAVNIQAALNDKPDIAIGNIIGSNISNILLILGISALFAPLVVSKKLYQVDVPIMVGATLMAYLFAFNGVIGIVEGVILFLCIIGYTLFAAYEARRSYQKNKEEGTLPVSIGITGTWWFQLLLISIGVILLIVGSRLMVDSSVTIARMLGISELIIGLTVVAIGTSMPEIVTSVIAGKKGEADIAVGNVVGSNIFNIFSVLGLTSIVSGEGIAITPAAIYFDFPVLLAVSIACFPIFFTGHRISRWEGVVFLFYYILYLFYLFLKATEHDNLLLYEQVVLFFILPMTIITFSVVIWRRTAQKK